MLYIAIISSLGMHDHSCARLCSLAQARESTVSLHMHAFSIHAGKLFARACLSASARRGSSELAHSSQMSNQMSLAYHEIACNLLAAKQHVLASSNPA